MPGHASVLRTDEKGVFLDQERITEKETVRSHLAKSGKIGYIRTRLI
jgi:hypothetical protein